MVGGSPLLWLEYYLKNRSQYVSVRGYCSASIATTSGAPKDHTRVHYFSLVYIKKIKSSFHYCTPLRRWLKSVHSYFKLDSLAKFYDDNSLLFNLNKFTSISFSLKHNQVKQIYLINNVPLKKETAKRISSHPRFSSDFFWEIVYFTYTNVGQ